jgi:hypothetical protein
VQLSDKVSRRGITALRPLSSLQEFLFDIWRLDKNLVHQISLCLEILPHLHAVAYKPEPEPADDVRLSDQVGLALSNIGRPCNLQLRHLFVPSLDHIPQHVHLPELQMLHVYHQDFVELCPGRFPKLSHLYWRKLFISDVMYVLDWLGQQLQTLSFHDCFGGTLHLDAMLKECPNLSKLDISFNGALIVISELQPDTLRHLQTLSVCISNMQFEILLQILRSVFIDLPFPNDEELKQ